MKKNYLIAGAFIVAFLLPSQANAATERVKWSPSATGKTEAHARAGARKNAKSQAEDLCRSKGGVKSISVLDWKESSAYDSSSFSASAKYKVKCFK